MDTRPLKPASESRAVSQFPRSQMVAAVMRSFYEKAVLVKEKLK
jgi:hypothetical protein